MRPPEFTGGNINVEYTKIEAFYGASMRPPEFTGGNINVEYTKIEAFYGASMRPPEFTGGNSDRQPGRHGQYQLQ